MLPRTATPNAAPSSRVASFMAEPMPARRGGTADMIEPVIGDIDSAIPLENGMKHRMMYQYGVCGVSPLSKRSPVARLSIPNDTVRCAPNRRTSRVATHA